MCVLAMSQSLSPKSSGYECKFVYPLLKRHECPICLLAMRNPMQTECGHLFCRDCLEPILQRKSPICPLDNEEISVEGVSVCRETGSVYILLPVVFITI